MPLEPFNLGLRMAGGFDSDALTAFTAVESAGGTLTGAQKTALNTAVLSMKAASIWTKLYAWFPIVGASAAAHSIDYKSATAKVTSVNSPTHSASGIKSNGTTSYCATNFVPAVLGATGSFGCSLKEPRTGGNKVVIGSNSGTQIFRSYLGGDSNTYHYFGATEYTTAAGTGAGNHAVVRGSSTSLKSMLNGAVTNTVTASVTVGSSAYNFNLLADNVAGAAALFTDHFCTQFWFGIAMSVAEITTLNGIITTLETALGR